MRITRSIAYANTMILAGSLAAAVVVGARPPLADERGHWLLFPVALVFAAPAITLAGTAWSGWLARHDPRPRGLWSRALFTLGIVLGLMESLWILAVVLGIGANA